MNAAEWDAYFMDAARDAAQFSHDRNTKIGCVVVAPDNVMRASGSNRFPRGVVKNETRQERPEKYFWIEHAERNAIYWAAREGVSLVGCRMYLPWFPCMDCARAIIQAGIIELIATEPNLNDPKWGEDFKRVKAMLSEAGVAVRFL